MTTSIFSRMKENAYHEIDITVVNSLGVAIALTDVGVIKWAMALDENNPTTLLEKSYPASGILLTNAGAGVFTVVISGVDTSGLGGGTYYQECKYQMYGQEVPTVKGTIKIDPTII